MTRTAASDAASATVALILLLLFRLAAPLRGRSLSLEYGLALLHESSAALDVVLAFEAGLDERRAGLRVGRFARFQQLAHDAFARADRERGVLRDHRAVFEDEHFQAVGRGHAVNEAHGLGLFGLELAPRYQHLAGEGRSDDIDEILQG